MKIKTSELTGLQLDYAVAVAEAEGYIDIDIMTAKKQFPSDICSHLSEPEMQMLMTVPTYIVVRDNHNTFRPMYSTDWSQSGPILEREKIGVDWCSGDKWYTTLFDLKNKRLIRKYGETMLIAGMKAYVEYKLGIEIDIPEELA